VRALSDAAVTRLARTVSWTEPDLSSTRYSLVREIGRGGMGVVYEARDAVLSRSVALKVLPQASSDPEAAARLEREARITAGLEHPGIVPLHDAGTLPDGRVYYAMKLVDGERLDERVRGGAPQGELLLVFQRILETVAFAHAHGVVHRDLKPENIMIGTFGEVLVMDWGVAKSVAHPDPSPGAADARDASLTAHGAVVGTPLYMSPEQARGEPVDARTDVYALGAILYFLLTGTAPVSRDGLLVPPRATSPETSPRIEAICLKALASDPERRYGGAPDLALEVGRFLGGAAVGAYPESLVERVRRFESRHRTPILVILSYMLMRLLVLAYARI
jgi:serine/threonine protein kinase